MLFPENTFTNYSVSAYSKENCTITKELKPTFLKFDDELYFKLAEEKLKAGAKRCIFYQCILN